MNVDTQMNQTPQPMNDGDIDRLLALATVPDVPPGAMERLMARIEPEAAGNVILFRPAARTRSVVLRYAAALPLAASLALGIYLGAKGSLDFALPAAVTGSVGSADDPVPDFSGLSEAEQYAEDNLS